MVKREEFVVALAAQAGGDHILKLGVGVDGIPAAVVAS
jgi:hypothetical protein